MKEPSPADYETLIQLTRTATASADIEAFKEQFFSSPQFHQLQVFSNQAIRILETSNLKYLYVSESMRDLTGYSIEQIRNGGLRFMYRKTHLADVFRLTKATIKVRKALNDLSPEQKMRARFSYDLRFNCEDGSVKRILQNCHILKLDESNDPLILLFASTDITPYKIDNKMHYSLSVYENGKGFVHIIKDAISDDSIPLSNRELEVLKQTSEGMSEKEIADKLNLSIETIKTHRKNMLQKTNTKNAVDLVRTAIVNNWI